MIERLRASSLRTRLIAALVLTTSMILAASLVALHERTGANLNERIDEQLARDAGEFAASPAGAATTEVELERRARAFIAGQGYHADSRVFAIELADGTVVTNEPKLIADGEQSGDPGAAGGPDGDEHEGESGSEDGEHESDGDDRAIVAGILAGEDGYRTVAGGDEGQIRVLSVPIGAAGAPLGTLHVADSLGQVDEAQEGLQDTIVIVALLALPVLVLLAALIAARLAAPLKRIERFATEVEAEPGVGSSRISETDGPAEVRSLAESFNHMLDRLQGSIGRQREFVADASHELRTPLTVARGEVDLLRRDASGEQLAQLDTVARELRRMERLVGDMLTLAGVDEGRPLRIEPIELGDFLEDLERELPMLGDRDYVVERAAGTVSADRERLIQVIRNLVGNAVAHTEAGGRIRIAVSAGERVVRFEVSDDGPGFGPGQAERVFDRFYRTDSGRSREEGGSGLGLAIARALIEAQGGRIWAGEAPGGGALVSFELPATKTGGHKARP